MGKQGRQGGFSNKNSHSGKQNKNQCFKQGPFQQQQPLYPSSQKRIKKLEDTVEKLMQTTLSNQNNFEITTKN